MPCKINLRRDQTESDLESSQNSGIVIFAATWVKAALAHLGEKLQGIEFQFQLARPSSPLLQNFKLTNNITLSQFQMITRLEPSNVTGSIITDYYDPDLTDKSVIYSMRDLVRQCVIIGMDETTHYGGYCAERKLQQANVYIVDLPGLQFQKIYNTGRLMFVPENPDALPIGYLDEVIYKSVVGETRKKTGQEIDRSDPRFIKTKFFGKSCYFDKHAYKMFIRQDVIVAGIGLNTMATRNGHSNIHFKFLKYGTGFFAGEFKALLEEHILSGVIDGVEALLEKLGKACVIRHVEFPFFSNGTEQEVKRLKEIEVKFGVTSSFTREDALKVNSKTKAIIATTNCGDPHAALGNEMGFGSVDAAIASNLKSKGNIFCPCLNRSMGEEFLDL